MSFLNHFDLLAPLYDRLISPTDGQTLRSLLSLSEKITLLDAGGGTGRVADALVGECGVLILSDESIPMLRQAKEKQGLIPVAGYTEALPFPSNRFDRILMVDAYHHLANQEHSLSEMWRVLAAGGRLIIEEPDIRSFSVKLIAIAEKLALFRSHFVPPPRIEAQLQALGATTFIHQDEHNAWIVADKPVSP